ncbi:alkaline phosphatase PhoX [uncultured Thiocystis sp.]|uniref:PhoX family protein n=1 Tax=uncultured Thiocystis sp. TaxID=1202134 RepID=UPI0025EA1B2D|nr:alkaline phosphatase PhoX [uncultured Thiocystis sp.]
MTKSLSKTLCSLPAFMLALGCTQTSADISLTEIPGVSSLGNATTASFGMLVRPTSGTVTPFATSDNLDITASIEPAAGDVGSSAELYLVAYQNGVWLNRDSNGAWGIWNGAMESLVPASAPVTLAAQQPIGIIENLQDPGFFQGFVGYKKVGGNEVVYNGTPLTFEISDLVFSELSVPVSVEEKREIRDTDSVFVKGEEKAIGYKDIVRTNEALAKLGGSAAETEIFGLLKDKDGVALLQEDASPWVCTNGSGPDHTSLLTFGSDLFAVTQLECSLGGAYITKLEQDGSGNLTAVSTRSVDFSNVFGTYVNCAGITTPWNTHLGSEEYEPPMAIFNPEAEGGAWFDDPTWHDDHLKSIAAYNKLDNTAENAAYFGYYFGWTPEVRITSANGDHSVSKHFSMGRFAHELAYVMPDNRTVYLSDDGSNVGLFLFIADQAEDLSAGTLYAARWLQTSGAGAGAANIEWINLGHAINDEIRAALDNKTTFGDMFERAEPLDATAGTCPDGFKSTNTYDEGLLCTRLKAGMDKIASRLETRLYAAHQGATTEFRKEEGLTYNPDDNVLYVAISEVAKGMEDGSSSDLGGPNHIRLEKANKCGAVYEMDLKGSTADTGGQPIDSNYVAQNTSAVVVGAPKDYNGTDLSANTCDVNGIASPDNLTYLPKYKSLIIGEDTSGHQNDYVWNYDLNTKRLTRIATTPFGAETTSPFWHANINGFGYLTLVTQHPYGESDEDQAQSPDDKESHVGYIGPFPPLD